MELSEELKSITYGNPPADVEGKLIKNVSLTEITWYRETGYEDIQTQLYGSYNFSNIMAAIAVGKYFEISEHGIIQALKNYRPENNRSQLYQTQSNTLILDAYNANPDSMALAIDDFAMHRFSNPVLILGDMFELGKSSEEEHHKIIEKLSKTDFQQVIFIGKDFYKTAPASLYRKFVTTEAAAQYLQSHPVKDAHILIKGSRGMQLERIIQYL